ncbi:MAG: (d)CMP kinase, partial [Gammaproteobacteria bacterium]
MKETPVIAIDGPSGSGKGTVCRQLASALGWHLLDSGALYRLVAYGAGQAGTAPEDVAAHAAYARTMQVVFGSTPAGGESILLAGQEVAPAIRTEEAGAAASRVAAWPEVRAALVERQRAFALPPGLVADGRDMGSLIFPGAGLKVFLTASAEERAARRHKQLMEKGISANLAALSREIAERDRNDATRPVAPLVATPDAITIDSTRLPPGAVVEQVL